MNFIARVVRVLLVLTLFVSSQPAAAGCDENYKPLKAFNPDYPRRAADRGIEGYVILTYTLTTKGNLEDITVVEANPKGVFDRSAIRALQNFVFEPCSEQGKFVEIPNMLQKFSFNVR